MESLGEYHHLRVFTENVDLDKLVDFLKQNTDVLCIVSEISKIGNRPHIHSTIRFKKSISQFRDNFRKEFPQLFGNKSYSINPVRNYDSNIKYCLKGKANDWPDVLYTSLTDLEVKQYYNEYWQMNDMLLKAKSKKQQDLLPESESKDIVIVKQKQKAIPWSVKLTNYIMKEYPLLCSGIVDHLNGADVNYDILHETLTGIILEHLGETSKNLDEFILIRLFNAQINAIIKKTGDPSSQKALRKSMSQKIRQRTII